MADGYSFASVCYCMATSRRREAKNFLGVATQIQNRIVQKHCWQVRSVFCQLRLQIQCKSQLLSVLVILCKVRGIQEAGYTQPVGEKYSPLSMLLMAEMSLSKSILSAIALPQRFDKWLIELSNQTTYVGSATRWERWNGGGPPTDLRSDRTFMRQPEKTSRRVRDTHSGV